jgi:hypothetical protein
MGAKSGRATVKRALEPDHRTYDKRACHSADDYEIIVTHPPASFSRSGSRQSGRLFSLSIMRPI